MTTKNNETKSLTELTQEELIAMIEKQQEQMKQLEVIKEAKEHQDRMLKAINFLANSTANYYNLDIAAIKKAAKGKDEVAISLEMISAIELRARQEFLNNLTSAK